MCSCYLISLCALAKWSLCVFLLSDLSVCPCYLISVCSCYLTCVLLLFDVSVCPSYLTSLCAPAMVIYFFLATWPLCVFLLSDLSVWSCYMTSLNDLAIWPLYVLLLSDLSVCSCYLTSVSFLPDLSVCSCYLTSLRPFHLTSLCALAIWPISLCPICYRGPGRATGHVENERPLSSKLKNDLSDVIKRRLLSTASDAASEGFANFLGLTSVH